MSIKHTLLNIQSKLSEDRHPSLRILVVSPGYGATIKIAYEIPFSILVEKGVAEWVFRLEGNFKQKDLVECSFLILCRCVQGHTISLAKLARKTGIPVIYEIDDDLLNPPSDEDWGKTHIKTHRPKIIAMLLSEANLVKAGSPELAHRLKKEGYQAFYRPYPIKLSSSIIKEPDKPYRIGYFGTPHHKKDINSIFPALLRIEDAFREKIEFEFIGAFPDGWQKLKNVHIIPYEPDYFKFLEKLASRNWYIGLAPLRPNPFNKAKSDSKFRDYTSAEIVGIYADLPPYNHTIRPGINGWLAGPEPEEWSTIILKVLEYMDRKKILAAAWEEIRKNRNPETVAIDWLSLFNQIKQNKKPISQVNM